MTSTPSFGIIGGAGSVTTSFLYTHIINKFNFHKINSDSQYPYLNIINYPFKSISSKGVINLGLAQKEINHCLSQINNDYIFIYCFSFHNLSFNKKIIPLPYLIKNYLIKNKIKSNLLILCSYSSIENNIFESLKPYPIYYPNKELMIQIELIIQHFIQSSNTKTIDLSLFLSLLNNHIKHYNISHIIYGCTELNLLMLDKKFNIINSQELISNFIFEKTYENS